MSNMMHISRALLMTTFLCSCSPTSYVHGVPNLVEVRPGLWRSGQPTSPEQWSYLKSIGVRTVVKLNFDSEGSDDSAKAIGLDVVSAPIQPAGDRDIFDALANTFLLPDPLQLEKAQSILSSRTGVLVHCTHGQDRTGLVIGRFRVLSDGWTKDAAYEEMRANHFHVELHGLHEAWDAFNP